MLNRYDTGSSKCCSFVPSLPPISKHPRYHPTFHGRWDRSPIANRCVAEERSDLTLPVPVEFLEINSHSRTQDSLNIFQNRPMDVLYNIPSINKIVPFES